MKLMVYSKDLLLKLYYEMLRIRLAEEHFVTPILDGTIKCPVHLYTGQEAIAAGVGINLKKQDYVFGNHRSHGHYLSKGGDLKKMMAEVYCRETGCCKGRGGSMHLIDKENGVMGIAPIVAGTISLALGAALSSSVRKDSGVTVTFFGDGSTGEGVLYESMNFAAIKKLPIIFACENNLYSTHLPIHEIRVPAPIADVPASFGITSLRVDGNDALAVYDAAKESVDKCRNGKGPVFIEFLTYRMRGHVGPDDNIQGTHTDIRPLEEIEEWKKKDPLKRLENYIKINFPENYQEISIINQKVKTEIDEAVNFAVNSKFPQSDEVENYVFR